MDINDIKEEAEKLNSNPILRYALPIIGLLLIFFSQTILTWKSTSERDARGSVASVEFEINMLQKEAADTDSADKKKDIKKSIEELRDGDLDDARMEALAESVDAKNGIWFWSLLRLGGLGILSIGLLVIGATGSSHEKIGALVAFGLVISRM